MKKQIASYVIIMSMLVTQFSFASGKEIWKTIPHIKITEEQNRKDHVLPKDVSEKEAIISTEESMETVIYNANAELAKTEENYIDRFIIKYVEDSEKRNLSEIIGETKNSIQKNKSYKGKIEAEYVQKLMDISDGLDASVQSMSFLNDENNKELSDIYVTAMCEQGTPYQVIELPESVDPDLFLTELEEALPEEVEYVQPDYIMELSGETAILNISNAENTVLERV